MPTEILDELIKYCEGLMHSEQNIHLTHKIYA